MKDEERIRSRLAEIEKEISAAQAMGGHPQGHAERQALRAESATLEGALAQQRATAVTASASDTAASGTSLLMKSTEEAARRIELAQLAVAKATQDATVAQTSNTRALEEQNAQRARSRAEQEDAAFWYRRYFTALGVANGAAFAALAAGTLQATDVAHAAIYSAEAIEAFATGASAASSIPLVLWLSSESPRGSSPYKFFRAIAFGSAFVSSTFFLIGIVKVQNGFAAARAAGLSVQGSPSKNPGRPKVSAAASDHRQPASPPSASSPPYSVAPSPPSAVKPSTVASNRVT